MDLIPDMDLVTPEIMALDLRELRCRDGVASVEMVDDPETWISFHREVDGLGISTSVPRTPEMEADGWVRADFPELELLDIGVGFDDTDETAEDVARWFIHWIMPSGTKRVADDADLGDGDLGSGHWEVVRNDPNFVIGARWVFDEG